MVGTTTVSKVFSHDAVLRLTGHEKRRVSVCLTAKADGTKLKPFIVSKSAKCETSNLNQKFCRKSIITLSKNGQMNTPLTLELVQKICFLSIKR